MPLSLFEIRSDLNLKAGGILKIEDLLSHTLQVLLESFKFYVASKSWRCA